MQCNKSTSMLVVDTNKIGAFIRVDDNESQRASVKMLDNNIYNVEYADSIQQNQMIGATPKYCIPLTINAITVQGISYSDPYFSSFNVKLIKMASESPEYMNKSDYAFKSSVCIRDDDDDDGTLQTVNDKSATNDMILTSDVESLSICHDNNGASKTFANGDLRFDALLELTRLQDEKLKMAGQGQLDSWGNPRSLRLCGGGENSLNTASGWGSPSTANNNTGNWAGGNNGGQQNSSSNGAQPQWNNTNPQRPPTSQADSTNNPANGNGANSPNTVSNPIAANGANGNNGNSNSSSKIEQLNSLREALYSQDGWGGQHVNQDTNWDIPGSPEPGSKVEPSAGGGPPPWKPNVNNGAFLGTDLWEANLRNGGQPPPQPVAKTPWGHTPTTNIGGTWGEDDDAGEAANIWTGPPPQQQWSGNAHAQPQHSNQQWTAPKKDDWSAWGEPRADPRLEHRAPEHRPPPLDPRHDLRGGISGRLNGDMWQHHQPPPAKLLPPNAAAAAVAGQWPPKDSMKPAGWEEPSPPAARRFDDGTSLWRGGNGGGGGGGNSARAAGVAPRSHAPGKPDPVWAHAHRNGAGWDSEPAGVAWDRDGGGSGGGGSGGGWSDSWAPHKPKPSAGSASGGAWPDDIGEWPSGAPKPQQNPLVKHYPKEFIWNSKQFRYLVEMGYKKDEVEIALRNRDMNAEEALELLASRGGSDWRREESFHPGSGFPSSGGVPAVSPAIVQKLLNQPPPSHHQHHSYNPNSGSGNSAQPSTAQLRMLVQQIQMAVSTGYLNHQILNQPLAPQTLVLLNQLLQQIKVLHQLNQQHTLAMSKGNNTLAVQFSMQMNKAKQQITALQNQITTQQALFMKQQAGGSDLFKQNHDPLAQLQNNFSDMSMPKDSQSSYGASSNQQSRLTQWKLPSLDKDGEGSEFSRAPGTAKSTTSPQLNMGLQPDSTWGVGRGSEGWGDSAHSTDVADGKEWAGGHHQSHPQVYDLVPEFEPGKPWKGNQMKSAEEDPAMTPGSVVRSPLSLASIKDSDMLGGKTSPPGSERSLSSSTWSYAPPASTPLPSNSMKAGEVWSAKGRSAPPPGLKSSWPQHHLPPPQQQQQRPVQSWQTSTWLLLKNLTAQIDGSTLKTLCLQHGPLQNFHLYLNQGLALARYSTREEAAKAQMALNNCVLSNTTIFAESPAESEVQLLLQHLGSGGGGAWRGKESWPPAPQQQAPPSAFPALWPDHERATPSSLNSFLPPDLLNGESI